MISIPLFGAASAAIALGLFNLAVFTLILWRRVRLDRRRRRTVLIQRAFRVHATNLLTRPAGDPQLLEAQRMLESMPPTDRLTAGLLVGRYAQLVQGPERARAVEVLEQAGVVELAYRDAVHARTPWRRYRACELLGQLRVRDARIVLEERLGDRNADVRAGASRALGHLGLPECTPPLVAAFTDRDVTPLGVAESALSGLGAASAPAFLRGLESPSGVVRAASCHGLASSSEPTWIALDLERRIGDHLRSDEVATVRQSAAIVLGERGMLEAGRDALEHALGDGNEAVRAAAARALAGYAPTSQMGDKLYELADQDSHVPALAAARTLLHHGMPSPPNWATMRARMTLEALEA